MARPEREYVFDVELVIKQRITIFGSDALKAAEEAVSEARQFGEVEYAEVKRVEVNGRKMKAKK